MHPAAIEKYFSQLCYATRHIKVLLCLVQVLLFRYYVCISGYFHSYVCFSSSANKCISTKKCISAQVQINVLLFGYK